jgi:hypothetical protein
MSFGPSESVSPRPTVRDARLVRFLHSVAAVGVVHLTNTAKAADGRDLPD